MTYRIVPCPKSFSDRFWSHVDASGDCWEWTASLANGYGHLQVSPGKWTTAHRVAYEMLVGLVPEGLQLDHLCRNRRCVNPDHLEPVTNRENQRRSPIPKPSPVWAHLSGADHHARQATECRNGHPYDDANTHWDYRGRRSCRTCSADKQRRYHQRRAAA